MRPVEVVDRLCNALALVAGLLAAMMMAITFADVVMRYFLNRPIHGAFELTEIAMALLVFFALPSTVRRRENIVVNVLYDRFPAQVQRLVTALGDLFCATLCAFMAWRMWLYGARLLRYSEVTMELAVPKGAIAQTLAVMIGIAAAVFVLCAWEALRNPEPPELRSDLPNDMPVE